MELASLVLSGLAVGISTASVFWIYVSQKRDQRAASDLRWRRAVFSQVAKRLWGLSELKSKDLARLHQDENIAAVRALNVAAFVFSDTNASDAIENYRRQSGAKSATQEDAIDAIGAMAKACGVNFPEKRADRSSMFGPKRSVPMD